mmetsp:Transcript_865/g.1281  ORF Transcript_865/g.1281 Transcript_865/m.1281 type:complete len:262 (+) Transcript_865:1669-2454(+)
MATQSRAAPSVLGSSFCNHTANVRMFFKSMSKSALRPGRCTFTTTFSPLSDAKCTCPRLAAAMGTDSKESKTSSTGFPRENCTMSRAVALSKAGTLSCSCSSSLMNSGDSTSTRVENCWPTLMKVGPKRTSPSLSQIATSVLRAETASLVMPSLPYVNFLLIMAYLKANWNAKLQTWKVRWKVDNSLKLLHLPSALLYGVPAPLLLRRRVLVVDPATREDSSSETEPIEADAAGLAATTLLTAAGEWTPFPLLDAADSAAV